MNQQIEAAAQAFAGAFNGTQSPASMTRAGWPTPMRPWMIRTWPSFVIPERPFETSAKAVFDWRTDHDNQLPLFCIWRRVQG